MFISAILVNMLLQTTANQHPLCEKAAPVDQGGIDIIGFAFFGLCGKDYSARLDVPDTKVMARYRC